MFNNKTYFKSLALLLGQTSYTADRNYQSKLQYEHTADFFKNVKLAFLILARETIK